MDIRHFRHFLAVADELHFGRAARRLNMEQAPLSQSIRRFERGLGVDLFVRSRRGGTRLSPAGAALVEEARAAVAQFDRALAAVRDVSAADAAPVSVGFVTAGVFRILPEALKAYRDRHAGAEIRLSEGRTADMVERVAAGTLDVALCYAPVVRPAGIALELLRRDRTMAALPRGHRLADGPLPALRDLAAEPLVFFPREASPDLHDGLLAAFAAAGVAPRIEQQASFTPTFLSLVAAGVGYALVQESAQGLPFPDVVFRPVADLPAELTWNLHLAWLPQGATAATRAFVAHVRDAARG